MPNNMILLETIALTQSAASVTFDNLPTSGYTDLKIVVSARSNRATEARDELQIRFNGDTAANYSTRELRTIDSGTPASITSASQAQIMRGGITAAGATANTFGSTLIYIPNYTSSNAKSVSIDFVTENNGTPGIQGLDAALWTGTTAITSIFLKPEVSTFTAGSTFSLYGIAALGTTPVLAPKATGGNIVANDGTYWYHAFTSSGNFVPQTGLTADVLTIAGGGAGSYAGGGGGTGGGGAGGLVYLSSQSLSIANHNVTIGGGGTGGTSGTNIGTNGVNSQFASLTAAVGGGYGNRDQYSPNGGVGANGGCGGGGATSGGGGSIAGGTGSQGGNGGSGNNAAGGGGGGAGANGSNAIAGTAQTAIGGAGGAGSSTYSSWASATTTGVSGSYAGGGGAGGGTVGATGGAGGSGGGGAATNGANGTAGTANTGSGGGGGSYNGSTVYNGGAGGSGIVIIRYPIA